jgi:hypothetical protein
MLANGKVDRVGLRQQAKALVEQAEPTCVAST